MHIQVRPDFRNTASIRSKPDTGLKWSAQAQSASHMSHRAHPFSHLGLTRLALLSLVWAFHDMFQHSKYVTKLRALFVWVRLTQIQTFYLVIQALLEDLKGPTFRFKPSLSTKTLIACLATIYSGTSVRKYLCILFFDVCYIMRYL